MRQLQPLELQLAHLLIQELKSSLAAVHGTHALPGMALEAVAPFVCDT
jgi:hypothetical protein